jgi:hypothetical protein
MGTVWTQLRTPRRGGVSAAVELAPGRYQMWCSLEGHDSKGMSVTLRVHKTRAGSVSGRAGLARFPRRARLQLHVACDPHRGKELDPTLVGIGREAIPAAWYAGLARGGVAKIGQVQLIQPLLTLAWSAALLDEHVGATTLVASIAVLASVVATQRTRVSHSSRPPLVTSRT